ncbi:MULTISPECIES: RNA polymerase sigma factor [Henriciella]|jgi:RNA polymerase sigma-70 factor (ECF subfamily)|uniref:DNA-directed RNA polymerase sigma-70 factor n=1 Tax=Henriciella pelagia TaxID=1977912 RepID=A0ABQ1JZW5_9PROT|nr:sigma-70 family RNA polymerase sigma factor [Henriciella pelagia]GGB80699.1 DNA-directed RNA polymerase sigma-70 factor [Henriciella pelagia]
MTNRPGLNNEIVEAMPHVRRFAYSLTRNAADADDLVQTVIERVLDRGVPDDVELKKWMFRVCRNLWIDGLRAAKTRMDAVPELKDQPADTLSSEKVAADQMMMAKTRQAIDELPDAYREVMTVVGLGGASYKEAAAMLDTPIGTIMSRLGRARAMVAERTGYHD